MLLPNTTGTSCSKRERTRLSSDSFADELRRCIQKELYDATHPFFLSFLLSSNTFSSIGVYLSSGCTAASITRTGITGALNPADQKVFTMLKSADELMKMVN